MSRPTPKQARTHRRRPNSGDRTRNDRAYRADGSWNDRPDRPGRFQSPDRRAVERVARQWADSGAYVIVLERTGWDTWRTLAEVDGPAEQTARETAEREAADAARAAALAAEQRIADAAQRDHERAALARLMVRPPIPRAQSGTRTARHITGTQR
ncbi:hypothetical protein GT204_07780 [Streptomyces sp. SID4919]|uniref:hypothetical protein n=1 Tax=unclassified Streptomyces TaxID=2593676 RepID=UPI0008239BD6|nr:MULTISPECIES: hypothetical protein [unclassified Streptomyces]MYY08805.1 hypothetical protein [Streptomyces sp. SID4919]SCK25406.1 hypothetical protein YW7DRAFT_01939 [Streptomyces sp. AmelKG-E11A]